MGELGTSHRSGFALWRWPSLPQFAGLRISVAAPRPPSSLVWLFVGSVLRRDWQFLAVTVLSCCVATTVATFQYAVFTSFRSASAVVPRIIEADYWVSAASVQSFDFPTPFAEDHAAALAATFPQGTTTRIAFGFTPWRSPTGQRGNVALVGIEGLQVDGIAVSASGFVANRSDLARLDLAHGGDAPEATIGNATLTMVGTVDTLSTYLGAPYVLTDFETAREILGMDPASTSFLAGHSGLGNDRAVADAIAGLDQVNSEIRVRTRDDFSESSASYWMRKTGAGLAIGLAAFLASLLTIILLSNGVLRFIQRYFTDLVSLLGHGATQRDIATIVAGIAVAVALATLAGAIVITPLMVLAFQPLLPWVSFAAADLMAPLTSITLALGIAMLSARGTLASFAPDAVFRT